MREWIEFVRALSEGFSSERVRDLFAGLFPPDRFDGAGLWVVRSPESRTREVWVRIPPEERDRVRRTLSAERPSTGLRAMEVISGPDWVAVQLHLPGTDQEKAVLFARRAAGLKPEDRDYAVFLGGALAAALAGDSPVFFQHLFQRLPSAVLVIREDGRPGYANPAALRTFGCEPGELENPHWRRLFRRLLALHRDGVTEGRFTVQGTTLYLGFRVAPLRPPGSPSGLYVVLFRDLTEIVRLRKTVARTEYFSTIGQMASWVAHEVRNPVFAILTAAQVIQGSAVEETVRKFAHSIIKEAERIDHLINDLLNYGKPLTLNVERVDTRKFLAEVAASYLPLPVSLSVASNRPCSLPLDRERIRQVFLNLFENARQAAARKIEIYVQFGKDHVEIRVRDDGRGIKPAVLPRIFTPFFTTKREGTGLGLAICKKIVEAHGGEITATSRQGQGTEILMTFPVSAAELEGSRARR